ncbi:TPA: outer membrane protein assembly factor BamE [Legionella pneumophila]|uniref:Outer membrane protein assembly factor BamE n=1 Tax=Legionella pneumophila TaxID=446 RepID=A0AAN5Q450_LEGPN|nr:outer membrane protein assembly factor BamE [Legionella pneumophila]HAT9089067.1 outer membrane protein assembly factor BamE [Legionella pneumophila subsp. pneumophila]TIH01361.1 outer membrane protein assembly factor BamE [Legionella pneumophila]HAT3858157.1 outer membrane protein assembly factor BamE [Legionella pneumophila]HAT3868221.1 outer membrane protein assembly factor BamE [Legionella pneumophila]HAT3877341.1 outer membrane protein assembly factor BamE [Legionella pneumophila]
MAKFFMVGKKMRIMTFFICFILTLTLTQCASYDFSRRITQQGNLLPQSKIARLKIGMSKNDVAILMGTSLMSPTFNNDRWDYAYTWRRGKGNLEIRNVVLYFSRGSLVKIEHKP